MIRAGSGVNQCDREVGCGRRLRRGQPGPVMTKEVLRLPTADRDDEILVFISGRESICGECGENLGKKAWIRLNEDKGPFVWRVQIWPTSCSCLPAMWRCLADPRSTRLCRQLSCSGARAENDTNAKGSSSKKHRSKRLRRSALPTPMHASVNEPGRRSDEKKKTGRSSSALPAEFEN